MRRAIFGLATCGALAAGFKQDPAEITSKRTAGGIQVNQQSGAGASRSS
jgi:hypothetical protein